MIDVSRPAYESAAHCTLAPTKTEWEDLHRYAETLRSLNDRLRGAYEQLSSLLSLGQAMNAAGSRERDGEILLEIIREVLPYKSAALLLYEEENYRRLNAVDMTAALDEELAHQCENGVLQWVREESHPTALAAAPGDKGPTSYAFAPLLFQEEFVGVLWLAIDAPVESLTQDKLQIIDVLAGQAAAAFRNAAYIDLERSYQQLHALESIKDDLTHMIIHDLRSPLTIIMGNIENALALATHPKQNEILTRGIAGCESLLNLINNLLDVSRMEEGKLQLRREPMCIQDVIQANLEIVNPAAARMHKEVVCRV
ncbi:MAG TPA: histidine kinase dimerization/phospho-acceptor domain-containing protein, partial [Armatimonadota bacterium]|nr:histidine kinase dimerization/phospho-acceptor domain-containing protein [Armatimonadota bacterium]